MTERRFTVYDRDIDMSAMQVIDWTDWVIISSRNKVLNRTKPTIGTVRPSLPYQGIARRALRK